MKQFFPLVLSLLTLVGCAGSTPVIDTSGLTEASINLDQEHVGPLLTKISQAFPAGFSSAAAFELTDKIDSLWSGQSANWEFDLTIKGKPERLVIAAFKDDAEAPDLFFFSSPAVSSQINKELAAFSVANGI